MGGLGKLMTDYFDDYFKMQVIRKMAESDPDGILATIVITIDETLDEYIEKLKKKKFKK